MSQRDNCPNRAKCGATGHRLIEGKWCRCPCLEEEIKERALGPMYSPDILADTKLSQKKGLNTTIEGSLAGIRKHVGRVLLDLKKDGKTWLTLDAYRLLEIFLGEDPDIDNQHAAVSPDLLILLLGFADPRNRYLPELILQTLARRELVRLPTWVILGVPRETIATKYSSQLAERLDTFGKAEIK